MELLGDTTLKQTLTNVVIPTFDIKLLQPIIFSTNNAKVNVSKNALLSDICIATSAAPTVLPAHYFETKDDKGNTYTFDFIDGAVAANNPTLVAINHIFKEILLQNSNYFDIKPMDSKGMLVISLGTGTAHNDEKYNAAKASKWGLLNWAYNIGDTPWGLLNCAYKNGDTPLIDVFHDASSDLVDYHVSTFFQAFHSEDNYLRIQDDMLTGEASSVDIATEENLQKLVHIGKELLQKPISRINLENGKHEKLEGEGSTSNEAALTHFAKLLSDERKFRQQPNSEPHIASII